MPHAFTPTPQELVSLELRWYEGRMLPYVDWLLAFTRRHRREIRRAAGRNADPAALFAETRRQIVRRGSLQLAAEMNDQRREIENELWYRGERGEHDHATIKLEWCARHAAAWRRWRIHEYLFVADRCRSLIVEVLEAEPYSPADEPAG